jgi:hypothetical protein
VLGVKRPRSMNREGVTPALGDHQARMLLEVPPANALKGKRDRAVLATLLYHGLRCEELCTLKISDIQQREGVPLGFHPLGSGSDRNSTLRWCSVPMTCAFSPFRTPWNISSASGSASAAELASTSRLSRVVNSIVT